MPPALDASALAGYAWLAIAGALLAYALWFQGVARLPVAAVSFLGLLSPVVATTLGWLVLGQSLALAQALGFALALASVAAAQLSSDTVRTLVHKEPTMTAKSPDRAEPGSPGMAPSGTAQRVPSTTSTS